MRITPPADPRRFLASDCRWRLSEAALIYLLHQLFVLTVLTLIGGLWSRMTADAVSLDLWTVLPATVLTPVFLLLTSLSFTWRKQCQRFLRLRFRRLPAAVLAAAAAGGLLLRAAASGLLWLQDRWLLPSPQPAEPLLFETPSLAAPLPGALAAIAIIALAPLAEEIFFRGLLLAALARRTGVFGALGAGSLIFAAAHVDLSLMLPMAVVGAGFAGVYLWSRSLLAAVVAHVTFNLTAVLLALGTV